MPDDPRVSEWGNPAGEDPAAAGGDNAPAGGHPAN